MAPIFIMVLLFFILYQAGVGIYQKDVLGYDKDRLQQICQMPNIQNCDDLRYAAQYCKPALLEVCRQCGENCTLN
jgi:hypothetical protein